jgi:glycosyltransferase involved in cell wall biosynthesis
VIVGDGALRARLEREALRLGLDRRCVFAGFRPDPDRLIPAFSLLCLTSRTEGLGSSLLDGMCFERAIVATTTGGIPEVVHHGRTGLLVPVGDAAALARALLELVRWPERRQALGRAGRRRFEREFTAERMVEATLGLYEELCPIPRHVYALAGGGWRAPAGALLSCASPTCDGAAEAEA